MRRHISLQRQRLHRLQEAALRGIPQFAGIYGHEEVRRAVLAFGGEALDQDGGIAGRELDLDAGFARVGVEDGLDQLLVAG